MSLRITSAVVSNTADKEPITPQLPAPQPLLHFWKLLKYQPSRDTLQNLYHLGRRIPRRTTQKNMHVILHHLLSIYLKIIALGYLLKNLFQPLCHMFTQYHPPILRNPDNMIFQIVNSSPSMLQPHAGQYTKTRPQKNGRTLFLPPASWGVSKGRFL